MKKPGLLGKLLRPSLLAGLLVGGLGGLFAAGSAHARSIIASLPDPDAATCRQTIQQVEGEARLPGGLLYAIALVESARAERSGSVAPWAWTINAGGVGHSYASKVEAIAAVTALQAIGVRSIDVGCMQVNLMYHPDAFKSLDDAFEPETNVRYASRFLLLLHGQTGDWNKAAAAYHSQTPTVGADYVQKVLALWPSGQGHAVGTPGRGGKLAAPAVDYSRYTPAFAALLRQNDQDLLRLDAASGADHRAATIDWIRPIGVTQPLVTLSATGATGLASKDTPLRRRRAAQQP